MEHAALLLLTDIATEVRASGEDGLRFEYVACTGRRYGAQLRIDETKRNVSLAVFATLPHGLSARCLPELASHLNAHVSSGRFEQTRVDTELAFCRAARIERENAIEAIRRLVDGCALPLELFEVAARRISRQQRRHPRG